METKEWKTEVDQEMEEIGKYAKITRALKMHHEHHELRKIETTTGKCSTTRNSLKRKAQMEETTKVARQPTQERGALAERRTSRRGESVGRGA